TVTGKGEPGTKVIIKDEDGNIIGEGTVQPDGTFEVELDEPLTNGEEITVGLEDQAGNKSPEVTVTAPDTTAPTAPTDVAVSEDGITVTGKGEPGTKVIIKDEDGNIIGEGTVQPDGTFEVELDEPLTNGEEITVGLEDQAGNKSPEVTVTAPDTTAPTAPTDVAVSEDGITVTGKGEPG
ncbi:Ig-like domain-containing protein, partial [Acinetobacter venetianus]